MTDKRQEQDEPGSCDMCGVTDVDIRPVMTKPYERPVMLCSTCYSHMDKYDQIDHEADQKEFGYGEYA